MGRFVEGHIEVFALLCCAGDFATLGGPKLKSTGSASISDSQSSSMSSQAAVSSLICWIVSPRTVLKNPFADQVGLLCEGGRAGADFAIDDIVFKCIAV